jgi:hypothetical protein
MLFSVLKLSRRARKVLRESGEQAAYFKLLALECALLSYLVAGTFINQFRAEILYWMILLVAVATKIHYLQPAAQSLGKDANSELPAKGSV